MQQLIKKYRKHRFFIPVLFLILLLLLVLCGFFIYKVVQRNHQILVLNSQQSQLLAKNSQLSASLSATQKAYLDLKNQDQYKINQRLQADIAKIHGDYSGSIDVYQKILDLRGQKQDTSKLEVLYASVVKNLSDLNYATAESQLSDLSGQIKKINDDLATAAAVAAANSGGAGGGQPPAVNNTAPSSGYSFQSVQTDGGTFSVSIVSGDLGSTRVIVDTASDSDCHDGCPVLSLGDYVARSGAYAGINGTYFCPASYPSCAGKTNSFDLLVMNKNKQYLNSDNNVYSNNPAFIFSSGGVRVVGAASQWGRDTGVDAVISNYPLLVSGGNVVYSDSPDPKFNSKGPRGFVAHKGNTVFIGDVYNATMGESAKVMKALGMDDAMNLDEGGSTALWFGGYKAGPGRAIPNALLFVRR
jgi:exopolysaccharide biosynthesis protein